MLIYDQIVTFDDKQGPNIDVCIRDDSHKSIRPHNSTNKEIF